MNAMRVAATMALAVVALAGCTSETDLIEVPGPVALEPLPELELPGPRAAPAGEYGWQGRAGGRPRGMHLVVPGREVTAMFFAAGPACLELSDEQAPVPVRVAGFPGIAVEPYLPPLAFGGPDGDETTRAYRLAIADRMLCAFVTWHATTTPAERDAALRVLDTIRAQPTGADGVRITFTLTDGWDTG